MRIGGSGSCRLFPPGKVGVRSMTERLLGHTLSDNKKKRKVQSDHCENTALLIQHCAGWGDSCCGKVLAIKEEDA